MVTRAEVKAGPTHKLYYAMQDNLEELTQQAFFSAEARNAFADALPLMGAVVIHKWRRNPETDHWIMEPIK